MKKKTRRDYKSIYGKMEIALVMMSFLPGLVACYLFFSQRFESYTDRLLFAGLILFSILSGYSLLRHIADQVHMLAQSLKEAAYNNEHSRLSKLSDRELNEIAAHFNSLIERLDEMKRKNKEQAAQLMVYARDLALSYQKSKREEELRKRLSRYVGSHVVERLLQLDEGVFMEAERRKVTVLFADIRAFTTIAERMEAEDVVFMLNQYFGVMVDIIFKNNGLLDKFVGDQLIAVFGLVESDENPAQSAVRTAVEMQDAVSAMMEERVSLGLEYFEIGIGINTGTAILGNVGTSNRMDYTVIGDCVNTAARLEEMAMGGEILIGEETYKMCSESFLFENKGEIFVKNRVEPVVCYRVLGIEKGRSRHAL